MGQSYALIQHYFSKNMLFFNNTPDFINILLTKYVFIKQYPLKFKHNINYYTNYSEIKKEPLSSFFTLYELMNYGTSVAG